MVSERHKSSLQLGIYKALCNHCSLIRRHHDVALPRLRSHDILLFSTWLKSAGKALWSYISVITNSAAVRYFSEVAAGTEQSQQVPVALSQLTREGQLSEAAFPVLCSPGACHSIWEPQGTRGWLPVGTQPGNRVTDPLPQTPEQQRDCLAFLGAAASSLRHRICVCPAVNRDICFSTPCCKYSPNIDYKILRYYRKGGDISSFIWFSTQCECFKRFSRSFCSIYKAVSLSLQLKNSTKQQDHSQTVQPHKKQSSVSPIKFCGLTDNWFGAM